MALDPSVQNTSAPIVPAQTAPTPTPAPPAINDTSAPDNSALPSDNPAAPAPVIPPTSAPAPKPNQAMPGNEHATMIGKIFQTIAGGKTTDYANSPNGPIPVKRNLAPGEMARNILGAAFSLLAAGSGGAQAGLQGRQYKQDPNQTIGGMEKDRIQNREQQAQRVFNNKQTADEATLRAHKDALEQQTAIANIRKDQDEHEAAVQAREIGSRAMDEQAYTRLVDHTKDYNTAIAMPGAEIMKDANGKELNFLNAGEAQQYVTQHPEVLHGSTNGNSKYGVVPVINPSTGMIQFIDYPAERHDVGIANFGQAKDKNGNPKFNPDGSPVPDGTVLDPKTKKPTVLTQSITPDQARSIAAQNISEANIEAEMQDRRAQANLRDAQAKKDQDLQDAVDLFNGGKFDKMTDRQKALVARMTFQEQTLLSNREQKAQAALAKATQLASISSDKPEDDPEVKRLQAEYNDTKNDYDDASEKYNQLTGNTAGTQLANKIIRTGALNAVKDPQSWATIDAQITAANLPNDEAQAARAKTWNAMSPAQQAAATGKTPNTAASAPANDKAIIYNPQGQPMQVPKNLVDQYLADPKYKGWHQ